MREVALKRGMNGMGLCKTRRFFVPFLAFRIRVCHVAILVTTARASATAHPGTQ